MTTVYGFVSDPTDCFRQCSSSSLSQAQLFDLFFCCLRHIAKSRPSIGQWSVICFIMRQLSRSVGVGLSKQLYIRRSLPPVSLKWLWRCCHPVDFRYHSHSGSEGSSMCKLCSLGSLPIPYDSSPSFVN